MITRVEKMEIVRGQLNRVSKNNGWDVEFKIEQIANKVDALVKKAKRTYNKFMKQTSTGSAVEDPVNLQVCTLSRSFDKRDFLSCPYFPCWPSC